MKTEEYHPIKSENENEKATLTHPKIYKFYDNKPKKFSKENMIAVCFLLFLCIFVSLFILYFTREQTEINNDDYKLSIYKDTKKESNNKIKKEKKQKKSKIFFDEEEEETPGKKKKKKNIKNKSIFQDEEDNDDGNDEKEANVPFGKKKSKKKNYWIMILMIIMMNLIFKKSLF